MSRVSRIAVPAIENPNPTKLAARDTVPDKWVETPACGVGVPGLIATRPIYNMEPIGERWELTHTAPGRRLGVQFDKIADARAAARAVAWVDWTHPFPTDVMSKDDKKRVMAALREHEWAVTG